MTLQLETLEVASAAVLLTLAQHERTLDELEEARFPGGEVTDRLHEQRATTAEFRRAAGDLHGELLQCRAHAARLLTDAELMEAADRSFG